MIEAPFHPAYYVDTEGCGSYEGLSDEQPTHGRASELDQAIIKAELDNMFRADLYQKIELRLKEFKVKVDSMSKEEFEQVWEKYRVEEEGGPVSIWHDASEKPNIKEKRGIFVITSLNGE